MAAVHEVRDLLIAKIESLGYSVQERRDENDPLTEAELPCVTIREGDTSLESIEGTNPGSATHRTPFFLAFAAKKTATKAAREVAYDMLGTTVNALHSDYNLGGQVQEVAALTYGGEEEMGNDVAAVLLQIRVDFCTSNIDFNTLI